MIFAKPRTFALPLLALMATSGAALAMPNFVAAVAPSAPQNLATEIPAIRVDTSSHGDDEAWFYFGDDDENGGHDGKDHDGDDDDEGDDDDDGQSTRGALRGIGQNCTDQTPNNPDCPPPPKNGLFTPGSVPQVKSN